MLQNEKLILITGSTGTQGGAATRSRLKNGWKVRVQRSERGHGQFA